MNYVNVTHEYGILKEVIIGRAEGTRLPVYNRALKELFNYAPEAGMEIFEHMHGQMWEELDPEGYSRAVTQMDNLAEFLSARGIVVHRPDSYSEEQQHVFDEYSTVSLSMFMRDPVIVIGNNVIETALRQPYRNKERWLLRNLLCEISQRSNVNYVSMPVPFPVKMDAGHSVRGPLLEGGDVLVFGKDILVGYNETTATSRAGNTWLQNYLGSSYRVQPIRLTSEVLHLDDGLSAVREGLGIIMREQFVDGVPKLLKDWDFIEVNKYEALNYLAANALVLQSNEVIIDSRMPRLAEQLSAKGVTVHTMEYDAVSFWAGGFRCSHHPIVRELQ